ncbi:hypothetical protein [Flavobacterium frigidarium]|uniref:hypothetical protein n=1 Tax=Flavobacterium frigidarium TaxID=99286 RepID=UPI0003F977D1|nr:hypothetical protein [Flavobacterium frigidarium]
MSFFSKNENFIKIKFHSDMRGMSLEQKIFHYNKYLKKDTLKRLKEYLQRSEEELKNEDLNSEDFNLFTSSQNELQNKTRDYLEVIDLLKDFEFESILNSIYFEGFNKQLLSVLGEQLIKSKPIDFQDKFLILNPLKNNEDLAKIILTEQLNLTNNDWLIESVNQNPIVKKLTVWIGLKLIEKNSESEITLVLFHYAKFWKTKYSNPYNEIKGIVLLNDLILTLNKELQNLKINFKIVLNELSKILDSLLFNINSPPFLENELTLRNSKVPGYGKKLNEFNLLLEQSCKYLVNYDKLSNKELFKKYFDADESIQKLIFEIIKNRFSNEYIPNSYDIDYFNENYLQCINDSQKLNEFYNRINYLFELKTY